MEAAIIESVFVEDQVYENINAPQWVDLLSPPSPSPSDDVAWFCRPDCKHPRTADDFLNSTSSKLLRSVSVSKLIGLVDWTRGEAHLKGHSENQDPNFSTPNRQIHYLNKAAIKSSAQKDEYSDIQLHSNDSSRGGSSLKATQSGKDLFGGSREVFGKMTEFCSELKKMASRRKEEDACNVNHGKPLQVNEAAARNVLGARLENKDRLPLLEVSSKDTYDEAGQRSISKKKNKIKRGEGDENIPVCLSLNNVKRKEEDIRTNPPTPQGFSGSRDPAKTKGPKSRLMEREMDEKKRVVKEEEGSSKNESSTIMNDGRTLDVFWFLKPCTTTLST